MPGYTSLSAFRSVLQLLKYTLPQKSADGLSVRSQIGKKDICCRQYLWLLSIHDTIVYRHNPSSLFNLCIRINGHWSLKEMQKHHKSSLYNSGRQQAKLARQQ